MTIEFEIIVSVIFSAIETYIFFLLFNHKLTFRFSKDKLVPVWIGMYPVLLLSSILPVLFPSYPVRLPGIFALFIALFLIHSDAVFKRIFWIAVSVLILCLSEVVAAPITMLITNTSFINVSETASTYFIAITISRFLCFVTVYFLTRTKYAKRSLFDGFSKEIAVILAIDCIYMVTFGSLFYYNSFYIDIDTSVTLSILVLVIISVLSIYLLQKVARKSEEIMNTNLRLQQAEMEHKLTSDMTSVVEDLRSLRHDMNNHMSVLQGLLSVKAYDDVEAYLTSITQELSVANNFYFAENRVLSVLLNSKISKAAELGITFDTEILTSTTPFSERDLCTVIGNIIENAIEASSTHSNPYIYFTMYQDEKGFHIQCDNTYTVQPVFENGRPVTTKENKIMHGIGTQNICSIVETYHGTTRFTVDEQFHVTVVIPVQEV